MSWNLADVYEAIADAAPHRVAIVHGNLRRAWQQFDERADAFAAWLLELGLFHQDKVGLYLYNGPEFLEAQFGAYKASLVPVNINFRYLERELEFIIRNAELRVLVFSRSLATHVDEIRDRFPAIRFVFVDDERADRPDWAESFAEIVAQQVGRVHGPRPRTGDDLELVYTGGTTGPPKGVMWRQHDLYLQALAESRADPADGDITDVAQRITGGDCWNALPGSPLIHGAGTHVARQALHRGGKVVLLASRTFSATEFLDLIMGEEIHVAGVVGDAFIRPVLTELAEHPGRWDLSTLQAMYSAGAIWSEQSKHELLGYATNLKLVDILGSSEAPGMAGAVSRSGSIARTGEFRLGRNARVIDENDKDVVPGSGQVGQIICGGILPVGYFNDPVTTDKLFRTIDGQRYSVPGDFARVETDGRVQLLGRGNLVINTGGEKIFPQEVEEALNEHAGVVDVVVVGVPDERFGQALVAVVESDGLVTTDELGAHCKARIAGYKAPRYVIFADRIEREANGKVDYPRFQRLACKELGLAVPAEK